MFIPDYLKDIMNKVINQGYLIYIVGGAVRDSILNKNIKDYDLTTNMSLDKLKSIIPELVIMKENNHRNTGVVRKDYVYEFSTFRGNSLKEDLELRDFKMNAIAMDIDGNIIDPFNGESDIKNKIISLVKLDGSGYIDDSLRILRTIRLSSIYNFEIDDNTKKQMIDKKKYLNNVSKERILTELNTILLSSNIEYYLIEFKEIFFEIIPELKICDGFNQHNDYHIYDVYTHLVKTVSYTTNNIYLRYAALFHDIGKPVCFTISNNVGHFYKHPVESLKIFESFANNYKMDKKSKRIISDLIYYHDDMLSLRNAKIYDFYQRFNMNNVELLFALKIADRKAHNPKYINIEEIYNIKNKYLDIREKIKNINYNGNDLIRLGVNEKLIANILIDIKRRIIIGEIDNNKEAIDKYVMKKYLLV